MSSDLMIWGGPVYCDTLKSVQWKRPTQIFCKPLEGSSNASYWNTLKATGDPLKAMLADANFSGVPGAIGMAGFSAFHEWASDFVGAVGTAVSYLHLCDSCFQDAGASTGKAGYTSYAKLAAAGKVRMTITSNGPWNADISYSGGTTGKYAGQMFHLTSGSKCVLNFVRDALGGDPPEVAFDLPPGLPYQPARLFRKGELYWAHYSEGTTADPHGVHIKFAAPFVQMYGAPWMAGEHPGLSLPAMNAKAALTGALVLGGAAALSYAVYRVLTRHRGYEPNTLRLLAGGGEGEAGRGYWVCEYGVDDATETRGGTTVSPGAGRGYELRDVTVRQAKGFSRVQALERAFRACDKLERQGHDCWCAAPYFVP